MEAGITINREDIIQGLQFTIDMVLCDASTGESFEKPTNFLDKITVDACKEAIRFLKNEQSIDKIDCDHTDCINHKYCDYETTSSVFPNKSEILTK